MCLWAAATDVAPQEDRATEEEEVDDIEEFETELDAMVVEDDAPSEEPPSPRKVSLLESNVNILEQDCNVAQLFVDAATSRKDNLYLGLDISTQSTGYAVLQPSAATLDTTAGGTWTCSNSDASAPEGNGWLRDVGEANLIEWGYISGNGIDGKKGDEVDVGAIVEDTLIQVAARCGRSSSSVRVGGGDDARSSSTSPSSSSSPSLSSGPAAHEGYGNSSSRGLGEEGGSAAAAAAAAAAAGEEQKNSVGGVEAHRKVWVVGVEDFMRRFLPGRSNAKSIFALAQLNGIVKYACHKHLGAKAISFHPSTPRSFYGLTRNKPEGKDMKEIVHDFALSQENGALDSRYEWPLSPDGSKADASFDITDAYLIARYSWHRDVYRAVADNAAAKGRFAESFRSLHSKKLQAAEDKSVAMFISGEMPAVRGKKKLKPMTERSARNAHRKLQDSRFTKAYEAALMEWFQQRVLGISS
eukprot:g10558.t1